MNFNFLSFIIYSFSLLTICIYFIFLFASFSQNVKAKALYDNIAENVDELAFRRGEILDVIEQNADGMEGWWLCSLRGRIGLCPGNRLRVIDYETSSCCTPTSPLSSPCSTSMSMSASTMTFSSQNSNTSELYENTATKNTKGKRRSWHINPNKVSIKSVRVPNSLFHI
jgi:enhancer-of-filamentation protein 1